MVAGFRALGARVLGAETALVFRVPCPKGPGYCYGGILGGTIPNHKGNPYS